MKSLIKVKDILRDFRDVYHAKMLSNRLERAYGAPLIIIGMHRSGTSLVTQLLRQCGAYYGFILDGNSEAVEFVRLNNDLLGLIGSTWDSCTESFCFNDPKTVRHVRGYLIRNRHHLWSHFFKEFGRDGIEDIHYPRVPDKPLLNLFTLNWPATEKKARVWGWKDPRTTLTLPIWLELFPHASVIHVIRNGIDVALSLWNRCQKSGIGYPQCLDLNHNFDLWEFYVKQGLHWRHLLKTRYLEIKYEELLANPFLRIQEIMSFAGLHIDKVEVLAKQIDTEKLCIPRQQTDRDLVNWALKNKLFQQLGYEKDVLATVG